MLQRAGFQMRCGESWLFRTVEDAINHAKSGIRLVCCRIYLCAECFWYIKRGFLITARKGLMCKVCQNLMLIDVF